MSALAIREVATKSSEHTKDIFEEIITFLEEKKKSLPRAMISNLAGVLLGVRDKHQQIDAAEKTVMQKMTDGRGMTQILLI